jgi:hypothetical protein
MAETVNPLVILWPCTNYKGYVVLHEISKSDESGVNCIEETLVIFMYSLPHGGTSEKTSLGLNIN